MQRGADTRRNRSPALQDELAALETTASQQPVEEMETVSERTGGGAEEGLPLVQHVGTRSFHLSTEDGDADFEIPKTGITRGALVGMIRDLLRRPVTRVGGELVARGDTQFLTVRSSGAPAFTAPTVG